MSTGGTLIVGLLLSLATIGRLYGLIQKKDWFWDPEKGFERNPLLSLDNLLNSVLHRIVGKFGVVIVNILFLTSIWLMFINSAKF